MSDPRPNGRPVPQPKPVPPHIMLADAIDASLRPLGPRLTTGLQTLDECTRGGIPLGRVITIVGPPGANKTGLATYLSDRWEADGAAVVYLAADEPADSVITRLGQLSGYAREELEAEGTEGDTIRAAYAESARGRSIVVIDPDADEQARTIEHAAAVLLHIGGSRPKVLVVDSLQVAACAAADDCDSLRERIDAKMALLRALAKTGVIVVVLVEMSRAGYSNPDPTQRTSGLASGKESSSIEYGASLHVSLHIARGETGQIDLHVDKNRLGITKPKLRMRLDFARASVSELPMPSDDGVRDAAESARDQRKAEKEARVRARDREKIATAIGRAPGVTQAQVIEAAGIQASRATKILRELEDEGVIRSETGARNARLYYFVSSMGASDAEAE